MKARLLLLILASGLVPSAGFAQAEPVAIESGDELVICVTNLAREFAGRVNPALEDVEAYIVQRLSRFQHSDGDFTVTTAEVNSLPGIYATEVAVWLQQTDDGYRFRGCNALDWPMVCLTPVSPSDHPSRYWFESYVGTHSSSCLVSRVLFAFDHASMSSDPLLVLPSEGNTDCRTEYWGEVGPLIYREWESQFEEVSNALTHTTSIRFFDLIGGRDYGLIDDEVLNQRDLVVVTRWVEGEAGYELVAQEVRGSEDLLQALELVVGDGGWLREWE